MGNILKIAIGIIVIILLSNFFKIPSIVKPYNYQTSNKEFSYQCVPAKGRKEVDMIRAFEKFKKDNPEFENLVLYRTFEKNWWKFWNWWEYLTVERWQYPFLS